MLLLSVVVVEMVFGGGLSLLMLLLLLWSILLSFFSCFVATVSMLFITALEGDVHLLCCACKMLFFVSRGAGWLGTVWDGRASRGRARF